jgi:hypothetical protein
MLGVLAALVACLAVAATVFGNESGVEPRLLLLAMAALVCVTPARRLIGALPLDRTPAPGLGPEPRDEQDAGAAYTAWQGRVNGGTGSARAATLRLVPALRDLARLRLAERRGISLDHTPEAAAGALGPAAWQILRPDAPRPTEANLPGVPLAQVAEVVRAMEAL